MRIPRLFVDALLGAGTNIRLGGAEAHYLRHVLRCRPGSRLILFNGQGGEYSARMIATDRHSADVQIEAYTAVERESALNVHLGVGIVKRDAMDTAIQKATELGATEISPLISGFTDIPKKSLTAKHNHWLQVIRSACEQCERNRPPILNQPLSLNDWLEASNADLKLVAHPAGTTTMDQLPAVLNSIALLTGPEGGLSDAEISRCQAHGFLTIGLGPRILRADTAPTVLLTLVQARFGDLLKH